MPSPRFERPTSTNSSGNGEASACREELPYARASQDEDLAAAAGNGAAEMLAALMPDLAELDRTSVTQLFRLLSHHLAFTGELPTERAEDLIGLLASLVGRGELPPVSRYIQAREAEKAAGKHWPCPTTLMEEFGSYPRAVEVVVRYLSPTNPRLLPPCHWRKVYNRQEIRAAIESCRQALQMPGQPDDSYPDGETFFLWNRLGREVARKTRQPDPRLPSLKALRRWFSNYDEAVEAARRERRLEQLPAPRAGARPRPRRPRSRRIRV